MFRLVHAQRDLLSAKKMMLLAACLWCLCHILDDYIYASPFQLYASFLFDAAI